MKWMLVRGLYIKSEFKIHAILWANSLSGHFVSLDFNTGIFKIQTLSEFKLYNQIMHSVYLDENTIFYAGRNRTYPNISSTDRDTAFVMSFHQAASCQILNYINEIIPL